MRYGILGHLEVYDGTGTVPIAQGRARLLLAVLLVHAGEPVSSDRLIDALWGETPPPTASRSLHNLVSGLRKSLGDGRLVTHPRGGYQLSLNGDELDAARFETLSSDGRDALAGGDADRGARLLRDALALWRGPAFGELAYEAALQADVARLEELRLVAVEDRIDADLALGRHAKLVAELEALVVQHPLRERLRGQLMLALYRSGRQADALGAYADARRHLVDELGIEPGPALRELERAVLEQDRALDLPRSPPRTPSAAAPLAAALRRPWRLAAAGAVLVAAVIVAALVAGGSAPERTGASATAAGGDLLVAINPATNTLAEQVGVGGGPTTVTVAGGAVWVINTADRTISRVDLQTKAARTFSTDAGIVDLAGSDDALWAAQSLAARPERAFFDTFGVATQVTRIDPLTGVARTTTKLPVPKGPTLRPEPNGLIAADGDATWALSRPGWVHRIDTRTGQPLALRNRRADAIAAGDGQVWVFEKGDVLRLDPKTGRKLARVPLAAQWIDALAVGEGAVWGADTFSGLVWRVDPQTNTARTVEVGRGVDAVAAGDGAVWAASGELGTVSRIDPETNEVTATIKVPGTPRGLAVGGGRVWVSVAGSGLALPAAGGLRANARVTTLSAPPCSSVLTDRRGDPDLLIASDLPLQAPRATTLPMSDAVAFVLREHKFRAGRFTLGLQSCDGASSETGVATVLSCRRNARLYARNPAVIGIVGPLNSYCAGEMLPILGNAKGGPPALVSPTNSDPELVRDEPDNPEDVLGELYPTGQRGYARVYPADDYELAAGAVIAQRHGNGRVFYLEDEFTRFGPNWAWFRRAARRAGVKVAGHGIWKVKGKRYRELAERVRASGADSVYIGSATPLNSGQVIRDLRKTLDPDVQIIGGQGFTPVSILYENTGPAARGVLVTSAGAFPGGLGPTGRKFVEAFGADQTGHPVSNLDVHAAAATEVLLDAIARSDGTREGVARALKETRLDDSVLGPIELDANGEPVSNLFSILRIERGGAPQNVLLATEGTVPVGTIDPPADLVGAAER
jgi:YVTN family beta-propeller protein